MLESMHQSSCRKKDRGFAVELTTPLYRMFLIFAHDRRGDS